MPAAAARSFLLLTAACAALLAHAGLIPVVEAKPAAVVPVELPLAREQRAWAEELAGDFTDELLARAATTKASTSSNATTSANSTSSSNSTTSSTSSSSSSSSSIPQPFDSILSTNFTSSTCPVFFQDFLSDSSFKACTNMWLLTQTSTAFFNAIRSDPNNSVAPVLDSACSSNPGEDECEGVMGRIATGMKANSACGKDLAAQNPLATTAMQGLLSYAVMRDATCLKDNSTGAYCYAEAVGSTSPMDAYLYELAAGVALPSAIKPTCDSCSADLLGVYSKYAVNSSLAVSTTYDDARSLLSMTCGPAFAPRVVSTNSHQKSAAASALARTGPLAALLAGMLLHLLS